VVSSGVVGGGQTFHRRHRGNREGPIRGLAKVGRSRKGIRDAKSTSGIGAEVRTEAFVNGERNGLVRRFHAEW